METVALPDKLYRKLSQKAEERGCFPEELCIEMVLEGLGEELDPDDLVEHYRSLGEKYLAEARKFLDRRDLAQASEKLWGASALTVKALAAERGLRLERHGSLWNFVSQISKEVGDEDILRSFHVANSLHRNFYEHQMDEGAIEVAMKDVERLVAKLRGLMST